MRLPILLLTAAAASASAATVEFNGYATDYAGNTTWTGLPLPKFNTSLGTLTGVTITINEFYFGGSFDITMTGDSGTVLTATANGSFRGSDLGFNQVNQTNITLTFSPAPPFVVQADETRTFPINPITPLINQSYNIPSSSFSAYQGTGTVLFELRNTNTIVGVETAGDDDRDASSAYAFVDATVTYTYNAVPEPSTYGMILGGLALAGAALRRRQKAAK